MLMTESLAVSQVNIGPEYPSTNDELNRLLCAAVVSKSFRSMLVDNPELAATTGYQGESFNLSHADRLWLSSVRPTSLVDFAANLVTYQEQDSPVKMPVEPVPQYVRVN